MEEKIGFGDVLRTLRVAAGFRSQRALADVAGLPQATVAQLESGRSKLPNTETLSRIAAALGMSVDDLIARSQPVARVIFPTVDGYPAEIPTDARRVNYRNTLTFENFSFLDDEYSSLFEIISNNLRGFNIIKGDFIVSTATERTQYGDICILQKYIGGLATDEICIRRKIQSEQLSKPGQDNARVLYVLDDISRLDMVIAEDDKRFKCVGLLGELLRPAGLRPTARTGVGGR
jgi:transcriptional regulator with XRE-family HTH domain